MCIVVATEITDKEPIEAPKLPEEATLYHVYEIGPIYTGEFTCFIYQTVIKCFSFEPI